MSPTHAKPFLAALAGQTQTSPPLWLMRQAGRYLPEYREVRRQAGNFLTLCYSPDLAVEVTLQPLRRFGLDAAILFSDILVVPHALGQPLDYLEGEGPKLEPVTTAAGLAALNRAGWAERLAPVFETLRRLRGAIPEQTALIGFAGAPWTVACYMVQGSGSKDWERVRLLAYRDRPLFQSLIDLLVEVTAEYLCRQIEAGAEAVQLFDSWAGVLPEAEFRHWVIAPTRAITARIKARHPAVPIIGFPRGGGLLLEDYARTAGVDALALDTTVPPAWAAARLQPLLPVQGNLDPLLLVAGGQALLDGAEAVLGALAGGPLVFNLGHGVTQNTPPEHVAALVQRVRRWPERG